MTPNEMTTFGFIMALGIVVDDAVVVVARTPRVNMAIPSKHHFRYP